jgi:hypothetical protein
MSTMTMPVHPDRTHTRRDRVGVGSFKLGVVGVVAVLSSAWGGIVPYVGPIFGYSGDGASSWHWNSAHAVLALIPGALGVFLGFIVIEEARGAAVGRRRMTLSTAGVLLVLCGAWFAIGAFAWPVLSSGGSYFATGSHLRVLTYEIGYGIGTGLVLVACGAFVAGWAARPQPQLPAPSEPPAGLEERPSASEVSEAARPG